MVKNRSARDQKHHGISFLVCFLMLILVLIGCGPAKPKVFHIGILSGLEVFATTSDGLKEKMTELGYTEGKNIFYDIQKTNSDAAKEKIVLEKFIADKVDLIVAFPSEEAVAAKAITQGTKVPVVFCQTNVEGTGLINSIAEPGGNITGVRYPGPDLAVKRFEILHEIVPQAKRIWVPYSSTSLIVPDQLAMLRPVAQEKGVTLVETPAAKGDDLIADLAARGKSADIGFDAILLISEPLVRTPAVYPTVGKFAADHKIPIGGVQYTLGEYTTLFGVATDNIAVGKLTAVQVDKVLKGTPAGTIPVISAESYIKLNAKEAEKQGFVIPDSLLKQANEVVR